LGDVVFAAVAIAVMSAAWRPLFGPAGPTGLAHAWPVFAVLLGLGSGALASAATPLRRAAWLGRWRRLRFEYWPTWTVYLPVAALFAGKALKHRTLTAWALVNPGIVPLGGLVGERKSAILDAFGGHPFVLQHRLLRLRTADRAAEACRLAQSEPSLGGFPVIAKPDRGENGRGVHLCRTADELAAASVAIDEDLLLQRAHTGPVEVGVLWRRTPGSLTGHGELLGVVLKQQHALRGDGQSTLRSLMLRDTRVRAQLPAFLRLHGHELSRVPRTGEHVAVGRIGNHVNGGVFIDGRGLMTPELRAAIDSIASAYRTETGGLDIGRFDIRTDSLEDLKRGVRLGVIEFNGVSSEPTWMYDPSYGPLRGWGELLRYWNEVWRLGLERRAAGETPPRLGAVYGALRDASRPLSG